MLVYVTRPLPGDAIDRVRRAHETRVWSNDCVAPSDFLWEAAERADGVVCTVADRITADLIAAAPRLRVISNYGVGFDNIDVAAATAKRVLVCNTPGVLTDATADLTFALLLATARRLGEAERLLRAGQWRDWSPSLLVGAPVAGRTLGIVGLGAIGSAVARRARGFDMTVLYCGSPKPAVEAATGAQRRSLDDLLAESDFVSLHVPLTTATRHLINAERLRRMKRTAILINTARGAIVDSAALAEALREGVIAGAGLDVFETEPLPADDPLRTLDNVVLLPHIGSATWSARTAMADLAADNLLAALAGRRPPAPVNPEVGRW
ncbi:MAG: D-glycerate dehydrogenase [Dehalococcoidia bacterium]|nr:D-glycerate dehydrogenase [Dehalococcoidia bacterium]